MDETQPGNEPPSVWQPPAPGPPPPDTVPQAWPQQNWPQHGWYPPGQPWGQPASASTWAIVSLVTSIIGLVPVAVVCGIVALRKVKRGAGGKGLAIGGLAVSGAWTLLVGGLIAIAAIAGESFLLDSQLGRVGNAGSSTVGTCLNDPGDDRDVWPVVDCGARHAVEVYAVATLEGTDWPGPDVVDALADDVCRGAFKGYVGTSYLLSDYDYSYFLPDEAEWRTEQHRVICVLTAEDDTAGSARNSAS